MKLIALFLFLIAPTAFADVVKVTLVNHEFEGTKQWLPGTVHAYEGDEIEFTLINNVPSGIHGFMVKGFKDHAAPKKGEKAVVKLKFDKAGVYPFHCHLHPAHVGGQIVILKK